MDIRVFISALGNAGLTILLYWLEKKTPFKKTSYKFKQIVYGVLFGLMAIYASTNLGGFDIGDGTIMNVRDAAPLCAGLVFGSPAGIIAGVIGGTYRYIAVYWGLAGSYTQIACSVSTVLAGFIGAALRKFMFDDKKPVWLYGFAIGMVCEIIHMLMIFFTNMNDASTAFSYVKICTVPMVLGNGISVGLSILGISLISSDMPKYYKGKRQIARTFQRWLFICIVIAYAVSSVFTSVLQTGMSQTETENVIKINLGDIYQDISDASDENLLNKVEMIRSEYLNGAELTTLAEKYNVIEVNVIDENGIIAKTNNSQYAGYDMSSGEQSKEFLILLDGNTTEYVQDYRPTSYDGKTLRKYGAKTLPEGGFLQVGYDASQFRNDIDDNAVKATKNRHVGNKGFVVICDENFNVISENSEYSGKSLNDIADVNIDIKTHAEDEIFNKMMFNESYLCAYRFVEGFYIIGVMPEDEAMFMRDVSIYVNTFMEVIIFAALFVLIYFLIKKIIIENIKKINRSLSEITHGNLDVIVDVRSNEEFASLSDDINSTVDTLKRYIDEAAARIDAELEFAKQIQYSSLPTVFPKRSEFDIFAQMITAKEVGGDFYDFYMLSNHTAAFLVADVSGKGIPAAMFMMRAKTLIKELAESGMEPDTIFTKANNKLCEDNDTGMFVTAWLGIIDFKTGIVQFANAGHNPPLICRNGRFEYMKARSGLVLAGMKGIKYRKNEIRLEPGDQIYLYTDGVTEAVNNDEKFYSEQRLLDFVNSLGDIDPEKLCLSIKKDVDIFVGDTPQFDDITMLSLRLNCILGDRDIKVVTNEDSRTIVNSFADSITDKLEIVPKLANKINIIFDEIYSNILNYSSASHAEISYKIEKGKLCLIFIDDGIPYNPLEAAAPDVTLSAEEREIGGLGIFIVKKMTESMEYTYENSKNILKLIIAL